MAKTHKIPGIANALLISILLIITASLATAQSLGIIDTPSFGPSGGAVNYFGTCANEPGTSSDNMNNAGAYTSDGDMNAYIYDDDANHPIEFFINYTGTQTITSARLSISAYDVDVALGEMNQVSINGHILGNLT